MYPENGELARREGRVLACLFVGKEGCVRDVRIVRGNEKFFDVVREAAYRMLFHPATCIGRPIGVWIVTSQ